MKVRPTDLWAVVDMAFVATFQTIEDKAAGNGPQAGRSFHAATAKCSEASTALQQLVSNGPIADQVEHTHAKVLQHVLAHHLLPLLATIGACLTESDRKAPSASAAMASRKVPTKGIHPHIVNAIEEQIARVRAQELSQIVSKVDPDGMGQILLWLAESETVGTGNAVVFFQLVAKKRTDLLDRLTSLLNGFGMLSDDNSAVRIATNQFVPIGDIDSKIARLLLAWKYSSVRDEVEQ